MAAPVVESVSTLAITTAGASQVITKPSGVVAGDFLVCVVGVFGYAGATTPTISSFTTKVFHGTTTDVDNAIAVLYKTADSGDVAASNYTITQGTAIDVGPAVMYRISGSANEIVWYSVDGAGVTRNNDQVLIMVASEGNATSPTAFSGYTITSLDSNPTWTEDLDDTYVSVTGDDLTFASAHASTTNTSAITAFSLTGGEDVSVLLVIPATKSATGTNALLAVDPTFFANTASVGTTGTNALHTVDPTFPTQSGRAKSNIWTNETKNTTTWTNEDKS
jgi:hypothetical protein